MSYNFEMNSFRHINIKLKVIYLLSSGRSGSLTLGIFSVRLTRNIPLPLTPNNGILVTVASDGVEGSEMQLKKVCQN